MAVAAVLAAGCSSGTASGPTPELCSALSDVFDSIGTAGKDGSDQNLAIVDDDYRRLTREANRSPGGYEDAASDARASWGELRSQMREIPRPTVDELRPAFESAIKPLQTLEDDCGEGDG